MDMRSSVRSRVLPMSHQQHMPIHTPIHIPTHVPIHVSTHVPIPMPKNMPIHMCQSRATNGQSSCRCRAQTYLARLALASSIQSDISGLP